MDSLRICLVIDITVVWKVCVASPSTALVSSQLGEVLTTEYLAARARYW